MEHLHDLVAVDDGLQQALIVLLLQVGQFLADHTEVLAEVLLTHLVLARDVRLAERHQVVDVVAGIVHQSSDGTIGDLLVGNGDGSHVQVDEFLHVFHLGIKRLFQPSEDFWHHLRSDIVMVMEGPASQVVPTFALRFPDVVKQGSPAKPEGSREGSLHDILQHLEGVVEVVLVRPAVARLHDVEGGKLGEDYLEQSAAVEVHPSLAGMRGHHHLVQLFGDAFATDYLDALSVARERLESLLFDKEVELCGKADATEHAQRVVAEGDIRVEGCANDTILQVVESVERIDQLAKAVVVQTDGHGVDGEVATVLVVGQGAVFYDWFTRVVAVALATSTDKFKFYIFAHLHLCRTEVLENGEVSLASESFFHLFGQSDATAHNNHVDVVRRSFEKDVAHVATHHITFEPQMVGSIAYQMKDIIIEYFCQFGIRV